MEKHRCKDGKERRVFVLYGRRSVRISRSRVFVRVGLYCKACGVWLEDIEKAWGKRT